MKRFKRQGVFYLLLFLVSAPSLALGMREQIFTESKFSFYPWLLRIDSLGDTLWTKLYALKYDSLIEIDDVNEGEMPYLGFGNNSMVASSDGGYLIYLDFSVLLKIDSFGNQQWSRILRLAPTLEGWVSNLYLVCDGGFVLCWDHLYEYYEPMNGTIAPLEVETVFMKFNSEGDSMWSRTFPGVKPMIVEPTNDCGFVIAGLKYKHESIACLIKLDSSGNLLWRKEHNCLYPVSLKILPDGRMIMSGPAVDSCVDTFASHTQTFYGFKYEAMRCVLDSVGNILDEYVLWDNRGHNLRWVDPENDDRLFPKYATSKHIVTSDGGYFLAGDIDYWNESDDERGGRYHTLTCFKHDSLGYLTWYEQYIEDKEWEHKPYVIELPDGYFICSQTESWEASDSDLLIFRLDTAGEVIWSKTYGIERNEFSGPIFPTADGGFFILAKRAPRYIH